jgi:hypothetical protein
VTVDLKRVFADQDRLDHALQVRRKDGTVLSWNTGISARRLCPSFNPGIRLYPEQSFASLQLRDGYVGDFQWKIL